MVSTKAKHLPIGVVILLLALSAAFFLPGIGGKIPFLSAETEFSDLLITHYPNALYLRNSIMDQGQIPLWSSIIHSGAPFAANPLSGLFYLPGWLALIFPLPAGISLILAVHVFFGSLGMYLFLKEEGTGDVAAIFGALAFQMAPKLTVIYGAGHVSLIYAISWTPWLFYISRRDETGWRSGIIAAFMFLADPRWAIPGGVIWISYVFAHRQFEGIVRGLRFFLNAGLTAVLLASPQILSLLEFVSLSTRSQMTGVDQSAFSLPIVQLLGLIIPASRGNAEWFIYLGAMPLLFLIVGIFSKWIRKKNKFWIIWGLIGLVLAMLPGLMPEEWLGNLPGISLLRVPARNVFITLFALSILAARVVGRFATDLPGREGLRLVSFGVLVFSLALSLGIILSFETQKLLSIWGLLILAAGAIVIMLLTNGRLDNGIATYTLLALLILDSVFVGANTIHFRIRENPNHKILRIFEEDEDLYRLYSPSYSLPQDRSAELGISLADGVDPLQLTGYAQYMDHATGVTRSGYSVTIPSFATGNPDTDNKSAIPDLDMLGKLNVKYLLSSFPITIDELNLKEELDGSYFYVNNLWMPRSWIENGITSESQIEELEFREVDIVRYTPNRIVLSAEGPGKLVISEIDYPGWKAFVSGDEVKVDQAYTLLRSVDIPEGKHTVELVYRPSLLFIGLALSLIGSGVCLRQYLRERR